MRPYETLKNLLFSTLYFFRLETYPFFCQYFNRYKSSRQPTSQRDPLYRPGATTRHTPSRPATTHAPTARVPEGDGTPRLGPHPTKRASTTVTTRRRHPCQNHERQHGLGWRENDHHHVLVHSRLRVTHSLQAHPIRLRVGQGKC